MINPYARRQRFMTATPAANAANSDSSVPTRAPSAPSATQAAPSAPSATHVNTNVIDDADLQLGYPSWGLPREIVAQFNTKGIRTTT